MTGKSSGDESNLEDDEGVNNVSASEIARDEASVPIAEDAIFLNMRAYKCINVL